jgi:hypothetical protein
VKDANECNYEYTGQKNREIRKRKEVRSRTLSSPRGGRK